jgi:hypothetical protein
MLNKTKPTLQLQSECKIFLIEAFTEYIVLYRINRGYLKFLRKLTVTKVVNSFHETYIFVNVSVKVPPYNVKKNSIQCTFYSFYSLHDRHPFTPVSSYRWFPCAFLGQFFLSVSPFFMRFIPPTILVRLITTLPRKSLNTVEFRNTVIFCTYLHRFFGLIYVYCSSPVTNVLVRLKTR